MVTKEELASVVTDEDVFASKLFVEVLEKYLEYREHGEDHPGALASAKYDWDL